jgi:arylsulfatase A-like enzyme
MDGLSLRPLVEGRAMDPRTAFFSTIRYGIVRDARWKYRLEKRPSGGGAPVELLFDIAADPLERGDLAAGHPEVVDEMRARYLDFVRRLNARVAASSAPSAGGRELVDDAERERLEALGYLQ